MKKTPRFNTTAQETAALQGSVYVANAVYPAWDFTFEIPLLEGRIDDPNSTIAQLLGLYMAAKGRAGVFLFSDPRDNTVTNYQFGAGDGTSQAFQLVRPIGNAQDIVQNVNGTPTIYINGIPTTAYSLDSKGVVTFNTPPASSAALSWTGTFYFMLKFKQDSLADLELFFEGKWSISTLEFESYLR
jgi:uncharacterized protein (TIGR02217 family)